MTVDSERCPQNHRCPAIQVCPVHAISQNGNALPVIDNKKCVNCGKCVSFCPRKAIHA